MAEPELITRLRGEYEAALSASSAAFRAVGTSTTTNYLEHQQAYARAQDAAQAARLQLDAAIDLHTSTAPTTSTQDPTALAVDGPILNPECLVGKHGSCHEDAWDNLKDEPADCQCACHEGDR